MIPDVVSQVLPRTAGLFDLVVFDEASQMPVEHALPSLFRAKRVVVSGDEKQMPPSSFFSTRMESDEVDGDEDDFSRWRFDGSGARREGRDVESSGNQGLSGSAASGRISSTSDHVADSLPFKFRELISFSNAAYYRNELSIPVKSPGQNNHGNEAD